MSTNRIDRTDREPIPGVSSAEQQVADAVARRMLDQMEFALPTGPSYAKLEATYSEYTAAMGREPVWGLVSPSTLAAIRAYFQTQQRFMGPATPGPHTIRFMRATLRFVKNMPDDRLIWQIQAP